MTDTPFTLSSVLQRLLLGGLAILIAGTFLLPSTAAAAGIEDCFPGQGLSTTLVPLPDFKNPECQTFDAVTAFLIKLTNRLIQFVLAIAMIFLMITGYQFVTSMGNKQGMEEAKRSLLYITIGILVVLSAFMVVRFLADRFLST